MSKEKMTPDVRFEGFDGDLSTIKLTDTFDMIRNAFVGTATPYYVENGNFYLQSNNVKNGQINRKTEVFINDSFHESQKDKWLHTNDLVMVQSGHVGHTAVIPESLNNTSAHALILFSKNKGLTEPNFLNYQFMSPRVNSEIDKLAIGNTIRHILASSMKKFEVEVPGMDEQKKVGHLFKQFDFLLDKKSDELRKSRNFKQAMLQKMFPKEGEKVPEIRFEGFKGEWEEILVGQIGELYQPKTISQGDLSTSGYRVFGANGYIGFYDDYNHKLDQVAISARGENTGNVNYITGPVWITGNSMVVNVDKTPFINKLFLYSSLSSVDFKKYVTGGAQPQLTRNILKNVRVTMPRLAEQREVGKYFEKLDNQISLKQDELKKLKQFKGAMLDKLFV